MVCVGGAVGEVLSQVVLCYSAELWLQLPDRQLNKPVCDRDVRRYYQIFMTPKWAVMFMPESDLKDRRATSLRLANCARYLSDFSVGWVSFSSRKPYAKAPEAPGLKGWGGALGLPLPLVGRTGAPGAPFAGVRKLPGYRLLGLCDLLGDISGSAKAPRLLGVLKLSGHRLLGVLKRKGTCYLATNTKLSLKTRQKKGTQA